MLNDCNPVHRAITLAAACAALFSTRVLADDNATVIVTAARAPQALADALPHTTVLIRIDIERSQAVDLAALLAAEAGVQLASNGVRGTPTALFVRGAPTRQVLVLIDGVALSRQDASGQVGIEHLMLDQVERVEIVRGNVSALYGSGAIGGVIQIFTRSGAQDQSALRAEVGARGFAHLAAQSSGTVGATQWSIGVAGQRDHGLSALDSVQVPQANPDRDGYRNRSATVNLAHALSEGQRIAFGLVHSDGRLAYDSAFATPTDLQDSRTRKDLLRLASDNRLGTAWTSHLALSTQRDDVQNHETGQNGYLGRYVTRVAGLNWANEFTLSPGLQATGGIDLQRQRIEADDGFGGVFSHARGVFALYGGLRTQLPSAWGAHELSLNLRHDRIAGLGSHGSGSAGWGWQMATELTAFASLGNAFSVPPLGYLYAPYFGNPALRPEAARSAELGWQWAAAGRRLRATVFQTRVRDELEYDDQKTFAFANLARTRNRGLELSYAARLASTDLRASLTSQRPVDGSTGLQRLRRSQALASMSASHDLGRGWRVGVAARYAGARPDIGAARLPAYALADVTAQWDFSRAGQWFARIENLGDVRYQTALGYNQAPRGLFTGLRWRLGQ